MADKDEAPASNESLPSATAQAISQLVKEVPVYQDLAQPAAQEIGKAAGGLLAWLLQGFVGLGARAKNNLANLEKELEQELHKVPPEKLTPPDPTIAIPAIQAVSYLGEHEEIRKLYVGLLASASNTDIHEEVHPSFAEVLKQFSPQDALFLKEIYKHRVVPMCLVKEKVANSGEKQITVHILEDSTLSPLNLRSSHSIMIDNLERLKVIEASYEKFITAEGSYDKVLKNVKSAFGDIDLDTFETSEGLYYVKGVARLTEYGQALAKVCLTLEN